MVVRGITPKQAYKLVDGTLPDIDTDFPGKSRSKIKEFMEKQFGEKQVCSVGTYTTFQPKGIIKDFDRQFENNFQYTNLITSILDVKDTTLKDVFVRACQEPKLKHFIKSNSDFFYMMPSLLGQPKTKSIHACAMIVFPDVMTAHEWAPMRLQKGLVVSEWGGEEMDEAGFLKDDILGIKQLDKFTDILDLIKKNSKEVPDIYSLPEDPEVYRFFGNGWNGDVFQFGTSGLSAYTKQLKPQNINDLIAAVALFRPGPMENHYHEMYVKRKSGESDIKHLWGTENITEETYGLLVYQEQIMQVCQQVGGLNMKEADDVRRAMGKKKVKVLNEWENRIKKGFLDKGSSEEDFVEIWKAMLEFAKYSFNKSHAAAYALTGYIGQWLKVHYPLEYWTVALTYASDADKINYLTEISQAKQIKISSIDVNGSGDSMNSDNETKTIFWGIMSVKGIGEKAAVSILKERDINGEFKSLADFMNRMLVKGTAVNKTIIERLIAAGAFDIMYKIKEPKQRANLIRRYRIAKKVKAGTSKTDLMSHHAVDENWYWLWKQKTLAGLADIDFRQLYETQVGSSEYYFELRDAVSPQSRALEGSWGGYVVEFIERRSKNGNFAKLLIESNYQMFNVIVWNSEYEPYKEVLKQSEGKFLLMDCSVKFEEKFSKKNQFTATKGGVIKVLS